MAQRGGSRSDARQGAARPEALVHPLEPVFDARSRVLMLGSFPSPKSREVGFYYGNPQNRFWRVLAALWDEQVPAGATTEELNAARRDLCLRHRIALWDVLASCTIVGASDASITDARPNDLSRITSVAPIRAVFCTGGAAGRYYKRFQEAQTGIAAQVLPSTSPANARWRLDDLVRAWQPVREAAEG
jgi:TDG/mug DNA glycosylase family protein